MSSLANPASRTWSLPLMGTSLAITTLLSAFLLFEVQPVISKMILPWFGGSPAVWTTCMLFFQVTLFGGYLYAHLLTGRCSPRVQGTIHLVLIFAALAMLPITPAASWKPTAEGNPVPQILLLLFASVGLPYFLLSATGPLMQAWLSGVASGQRSGSVYRLYALSNAGSLGALVSYPFLIEPHLATGAQGAWWSFGFSVFGLACGFCALRRRRCEPASANLPKPASVSEAAPTAKGYFVWLALAAGASLMLLAITNRVCQDVAVIPFLWIVPLGLYLLSFIICFEREGWYCRRWYGLALAVSLIGVSVTMTGRLPLPLWAEVVLNFLVLFLISMVCHGELARRKPGTTHLTAFYLMCSAGGAMGGLLVAVVAPLVFSGQWEFKIGLFGCYLLAVAVILSDSACYWIRGTPTRRLGFALAAFAGLLPVLSSPESLALGKVVAASRSFYGVLNVDENHAETSDQHCFVLRHGRILHGLQFVAEDRRRLPTSYYHRTSGIGLTLDNLTRLPGRRIGAVGLGVGTIAAYGRAGDYFRFYEINPDVERLARSHFSFLADTPARSDVVLGDARLSLERETSQRFDLLVLDAFSGDAIPTHLLTQEAFEVYLRHLCDDGLLAIHITNRHVNLNPVVLALARRFELHTARIKSAMNEQEGAAAAVWVLVSRRSEFFEQPAIRTAIDQEQVSDAGPLVLWRDDYSNLLEVLQ